MKWHKIFFSTFILVFLAELGDKTQIASFSIAAESGNVLSAILGSAAALTAATLMAVAAGHLIARYLPKKVLKIASGVLFLGTGIFILASRLFF
ncbi:MAG: TMEM165/GDT1 family protein [Spirochaetales bacterium]|nr:TMEM165/GDT1 family protein [Spirochaetales bacterium]